MRDNPFCKLSNRCAQDYDYWLMAPEAVVAAEVPPGYIDSTGTPLASGDAAIEGYFLELHGRHARKYRVERDSKKTVNARLMFKIDIGESLVSREDVGAGVLEVPHQTDKLLMTLLGLA